MKILMNYLHKKQAEELIQQCSKPVSWMGDEKKRYWLDGYTPNAIIKSIDPTLSINHMRRFIASLGMVIYDSEPKQPPPVLPPRPTLTRSLEVAPSRPPFVMPAPPAGYPPVPATPSLYDPEDDDYEVSGTEDIKQSLEYLTNIVLDIKAEAHSFYMSYSETYNRNIESMIEFKDACNKNIETFNKMIDVIGRWLAQTQVNTEKLNRIELVLDTHTIELSDKNKAH